MADNSAAVKDKPQNDTSADDDFMAKLAQEKPRPHVEGGKSLQQYLVGEGGGQPTEDDDHSFMAKLANKSSETSDNPVYAQPKQPTQENPLIGYLSNVAKNVGESATKMVDQANNNPVVQGADALQGSALKGAARAMTLPIDVIAGLAGQKPVPLNIDQDPVLNQNIANHPIAAGIGNFGGAGVAMMANPIYGTEALGKQLLPIAADAMKEAPVIAKMAQAALGSLPISAAMAIQQQSADNKGKIDWMKAAQLTAGYVAANAGITGAGALLGETGKNLVNAVSQQLEKAKQTAPLKQAASFQQSSPGQPGGLVADILNQMGQVSRRVSVSGKVLEFTDPQDAALFNAGKGIANKEGRKAWQTLRNAGMTDAQITDQSKEIKDGASLIAKDEKSPSVTIPQGAAQKRAQAEAAAKQAEKDAKTQEKQDKQTNSAQDKRAKELTKKAEKDAKEAEKLAEQEKKKQQDAFAKEIDDREKAVAKAEADAEKYKKSGQKKEEAKARKQLAEQQKKLDKAKADLDEANVEWEKAGKIKAGVELDKLSTEANFANRDENWEYRHDAIPAFDKTLVPKADRQKFSKALTAIVDANKTKLAAKVDYDASQDLVLEAFGLGSKQGKNVLQSERERLRATTPGLELKQGDPFFNILPQTRPPVSAETEQYAKDLRRFMTSGKDYRQQVSKYMMEKKAAYANALAAYQDIVANKSEINPKGRGDIVRKYMQPGTQLDHGDANVWYREGDTTVDAGKTKASKTAKSVYTSGLQSALNNPATSAVFKVSGRDGFSYINNAVKELKNTANFQGNKAESKKLNAILDFFKETGSDKGLSYGTFIPPNIIRTAYAASTILTRTFGHVIPSKRTLFSLSSTINNLDVYNDTIPELADYMRGKMAAIQRQSMGVEFPKTPETNDAYMSGLRTFSDDTIDDALAAGEGEFAKLPEATRHFIGYIRQQRREIIQVMKGIKDHFFGEGDNYVPPTNPFDPGRMQLHHVISSDIDTLSGASGATNRFSADMARNLYVSQLTGKISPHVAHITSALQNNTSYDPIWWLRIGQGLSEGPELKQAAEAFNNQGPLRSLINEREINPEHEKLNWVMEKIDNSWIGNARDAVGGLTDKAMNAEQKQNLINFLTGATTETAKTTVTRMGAIARAAQKEGLTPGQGAKLLLEDANSSEPNLTALKMHYSIAQDMREIIGNNAPGIRTTTISDHLPLAKILAPYNFQRNINARLWLSYVGDMGEALRRGDNIEAGKAFGKAMLHTGIAVTYMGAKALPVEVVAATNFVNPKLAQAVNTQLNQWAIISQASNLNMGHMQMSLNPTASATNLGFIGELKNSYDQLHNGLYGLTPPKDDEEASRRYAGLATSAAFLLALAGHTEFTKVLGTQAAIQYYKAFQKIQAGIKDIYYRAQPYGVIGGGYIVGKEKDIPTTAKEEITHALTGGETWQEFVKDTQFNANEGARLNMQYFHNKEYNSIIKQQSVDDARMIFGADDAKLFGYKKKAIRDMNWIDLWNGQNATPESQALDTLQKQPPPTETGGETKT